jgi:hypothetical protein
MKRTEYARIAEALGISVSEAAELEAEWHNWHALQIDQQDKHEPIHTIYARN